MSWTQFVVLLIFLSTSGVAGAFYVYRTMTPDLTILSAEAPTTTNAIDFSTGAAMRRILDQRSEDGVGRWISIELASMSHFTLLIDGIYVDGQKISKVDPSTFLIFRANNGDEVFARDKDHIFGLDGVFLDGIDSDSFRVLGHTKYVDYAKDAQHAFWFTGLGWGAIPDAELDSFTTNERFLPYAKDQNHVFYLGGLVENADPDSFGPIPSSGYAKDQYHVYSRFGYGSSVKLVKGADPNTFHPFPPTIDSGGGLAFSYYGADSSHIYCQGSDLSGADLATFTQIDFMNARDKFNTYDGCHIYSSAYSP